MNNSGKCKNRGDLHTEDFAVANACYCELYCVLKKQMITDVANHGQRDESNGDLWCFQHTDNCEKHHHMNNCSNGKTAYDTD